MGRKVATCNCTGACMRTGKCGGAQLPDDLYKVHGELVQKQFDTGLTSFERRALRRVRKAIDAAEMELMGPSLGRLDAVIANARAIRASIDELLRVANG